LFASLHTGKPYAPGAHAGTPFAALDADQALISVIIPSYNHAGFLPESIDSVLAQTYPHYEIIVIDDGSSDNTAEVVRRYAGVRYVKQRNQGLAAARNRGVHESKGACLVFLDADDHLLPHHLRTCLDAFRAHPDIGWVCGDHRLFGEPDGTQPFHRCAPSPDYYASFLRIGFITNIATVMFRKEIVLDVGGFSDDLRMWEDRDLYLRLARRWPLHCHHDVISEYRRSAGQMSKRSDVMLKTGMDVLRRQWPYARQRPVYREAYREGVYHCRRRYGEEAVWQLVARARRLEFAAAFRALRILLFYHPQGLVDLVKGKMARVLAKGSVG
jgi:glycosyltransferase involved in cell wall biosynthesis